VGAPELVRELTRELAPLAARALPACLDVTLKATLVLLAAHLVTRWGMRRAAAATRHLVWSAAVAAVLALPVLAAVAPRWTAPALPDLAARAAAGLAAAGPAAAAPAAPTGVVPNDPPHGARSARGAADAAYRAPRAGRPAAPAPGPAPLPAAAVPTAAAAVGAAPPVLWAAALWAAGALAVLARLALGTVGLARLVRRARPADDPAWVMPMQRLARQLGVRRPVTLLVGRSGTVPVTWGVVYPVVLLPADAAEWSAERRRVVLLHELAHVVRLDAFTQALAQLATALFWFNPLVTLAARRLRAERERACDDLVLAAGGVRATAYADDLLDLVRTLGDASPAAAALAMARRSEFEGRLLAILDPRAPRARTSARRAVAAAALAAAVAVPLAGMRPAAGAPADAPGAADAPSAAPSAAPAPNARGAAAPAARVAAGPLRTVAARAAAADAALPAPPAPAVGRAAARARVACGGPNGGEHHLIDDHGGSVYRVADRGWCLEVEARGGVEFTRDYGDVRRVPPGGLLTVTETRTAGPTRRMRVTPGPDGRPAWRYTVDDAERPAAEGARWFRDALVTAARRGGLGPEAQAARRRPYLARASGEEVQTGAAPAPAVPAPPAPPARAGATAWNLTPEAAADVARATAGVSSDTDKGAVLVRLAPRALASADGRRAFYDAAGTMSSDAERTRVLLAALAASGDAQVLVPTLDALAPVTSDAARTAVLAAVAARRPFEQAAVRRRYFALVDGMTSDAARERALLATLAAGEPCPEAVRAVLASAARFTSDQARANVLLGVAAHSDALRQPESRAAFFAALAPVTSSREYRRVMDAVVPR
jgi:beta-lactamase regulating signal transducer with metallopeptidase domain